MHFLDHCGYHITSTLLQGQVVPRPCFTIAENGEKIFDSRGLFNLAVFPKSNSLHFRPSRYRLPNWQCVLECNKPLEHLPQGCAVSLDVQSFYIQFLKDSLEL